MTAPKNQPISKDAKSRFRAYLLANPAWGSLHVVMEDLNTEDGFVRECIEFAERNGDAEGKALGEILLGLSESQRTKLATETQASFFTLP